MTGSGTATLAVQNGREWAQRHSQEWLCHPTEGVRTQELVRMFLPEPRQGRSHVAPGVSPGKGDADTPFEKRPVLSSRAATAEQGERRRKDEISAGPPTAPEAVAVGYRTSTAARAAWCGESPGANLRGMAEGRLQSVARRI